jgi:HEAT repeat protein
LLKSIAISELEDELAQAAIYAIGNNNEKEAADALMEIIKGSKSEAVRKAAIYSLCEMLPKMKKNINILLDVFNTRTRG